MSEQHRPMLAQPREVSRSRDRLLETVIENTRQGGFDVDAFHVMEKRDNTLIADEILNGAGSNKFVYSFNLQGKEVSGVSVIGARHLATQYGGLKHRIVASVQKTGALHVFKSYPSEHQPMRVIPEVIRELDDEPDYYEVLVEITDIKTGNSLQVEKRELAEETRRDGSKYARPHYQIIAQSKAFRNGILDVVPQDVVLKWKQQQLALGKSEDVVEGVRDQKLSAILQFAAAKGIPLERSQVEALTMDQIGGLREAATNGLAAFTNSAISLKLMVAAEEVATEQKLVEKTKVASIKERVAKVQQQAGPPETDAGDPGPQDPRASTPHDPETGEITQTRKAAPASTAPKKELF